MVAELLSNAVPQLLLVIDRKDLLSFHLGRWSGDAESGDEPAPKKAHGNWTECQGRNCLAVGMTQTDRQTAP